MPGHSSTLHAEHDSGRDVVCHRRRRPGLGERAVRGGTTRGGVRSGWGVLICTLRLGDAHSWGAAAKRASASTRRGGSPRRGCVGVRAIRRGASVFPRRRRRRSRLGGRNSVVRFGLSLLRRGSRWGGALCARSGRREARGPLRARIGPWPLHRNASVLPRRRRCCSRQGGRDSAARFEPALLRRRHP